MDKAKVAAVIQARMGSTRLPGKVLYPVAGKPLLAHIIERLRRSRMVDVIAIATSDQSVDDALVTFAKEQGVELVRGPEANVLQRYAKAAEQLQADVIVRVTGDAPLVDSDMVDLLVETLLHEGAEYCTGEQGVHSIHEGFCPFTRAALIRLLAEAADDPVAIEHVTAYFVAHPERFNIARIAIPAEHQFEGARMSVDTPTDVRFIEEIYRRLGVPAAEADMAEVVKLLKAHPELLEINGHVYQKKATDRSLKVLVRCDGDVQLGMGHVVRCLALADELREMHGCGVSFAMMSGEPGKALVREAGFPIAPPPVGQEEEDWLGALINERRPDIMLLDVRSELSPTRVRSWREGGILVATIDDPSERCRESDLAFYPPVPQVYEHDWNSYTGELHVGWEWVVLRHDFALAEPPAGHNPPRLLVTMGGSDPAGLTLLALRELDQLNESFETVVVLGPGFIHGAELDAFLAEAKRSYRIEIKVHDMAALMRQADLALASFGVTAYELAAVGVPAIYLCLTADHARSASKFVEDGIALSCGQYQECRPGLLAATVRSLLPESAERCEMGVRARRLVDGLGATRIAATLIDRSLARHV